MFVVPESKGVANRPKVKALAHEFDEINSGKVMCTEVRRIQYVSVCDYQVQRSILAAFGIQTPASAGARHRRGVVTAKGFVDPEAETPKAHNTYGDSKNILCTGLVSALKRIFLQRITAVSAGSPDRGYNHTSSAK